MVLVVHVVIVVVIEMVEVVEVPEVIRLSILIHTDNSRPENLALRLSVNLEK